MGTVESILLSVSGLVWLALEIGLMVRDRRRGMGGTARDRGTRALTWGVGVAAIVVADVLGGVVGRHSTVRIHGIGTAGWVAALVIIWLGLAIRVWAIVTLGRSFRTTVEVDTEQAVVSRGPYRWVRHPSYTGIIVIAIGFGLAYGTWPGLAVCVLLPAAALLRRIRVEEAELTRTIGDPYRAYAERTKRLVPGLY